MNMLESVKAIYKKISAGYSKLLMFLFYPSCKLHSRISFWEYVFPQRLINLHNSRHCRWPVHFTSQVACPERIKVGIYSAPGRSPGCYIQAINGIFFGDNVTISPGVKIIAANHDFCDYKKHTKMPPIKIGDNCWLGANCIILPGVQLGEHVIVGAGAVVTKSFSDNCLIGGVPAKLIKQIEPYCENGDDA